MNRWIATLTAALLTVGMACAAHAQGQGKDHGKDRGSGGYDDKSRDKQQGDDPSNRGQATSECNHRANDRQLKGQERKDFVEWCESRGGRYGYDDKRYSRERDCYQRANDKGLSGDKRKSYLNNCLDETDRMYEGSKAKDQAKSDVEGGLGEVLKRGDKKN